MKKIIVYLYDKIIRLICLINAYLHVMNPSRSIRYQLKHTTDNILLVWERASSSKLQSCQAKELPSSQRWSICSHSLNLIGRSCWLDSQLFPNSHTFFKFLIWPEHVAFPDTAEAHKDPEPILLRRHGRLQLTAVRHLGDVADCLDKLSSGAMTMLTMLFPRSLCLW